MNKMKAIVVEAPGAPDVLECREVQRPVCKDGWSLVKVKGFGINHSEVFTRQGLSPSVKFPRILGIECVGVVAETTDPEGLPVGQKIVSIMGEMGRDFDGSYAEYVLLPNEQIYPVETSLDWSSLITLPETYYTAFLALENLRIQDGDKILVRGATSGVGTAFLKLVRGKYPKMEVDGSTRNLEKSLRLQELGFTEVVQEENGILCTEKKYDKVLELVGPATIKDSLQHTEESGIVCSCGQLGGKWYLEEFDPIMELCANKYLTTAYSGNVSKEKLQKLIDYVEEHEILIEPDHIFGLEEVAEAHRRIESGQSFGKNIVVL